MSTQDETSLEIGPPPILPSINKRLDQYLEDPELLPMHNDQPIRIWNRIPQPKRLLFTEIAPLSTTLKVERDPATGNSLQSNKLIFINLTFRVGFIIISYSNLLSMIIFQENCLDLKKCQSKMLALLRKIQCP